MRNFTVASAVPVLTLLMTACVDGPTAATDAPPPSWGLGGEIRVEPPAGPSFQQSLAWSPDGTEIAYVELLGPPMDPNNLRLRLVDVATGDTRDLATNAVGVTWSAPGGQIAFLRRVDGANDVFFIDPDSGAIRQMTQTPESETDFSWSPSGGHVAFSDGTDRRYDLLLAEGDFSKRRPIAESAAKAFGAIWSPDGKKVAYFQETGDSKDQIHVYDLGASASRRVTSGENHNVYPDFYDNQTVYFVSTLGDSSGTEGHVVLAGLDGTVTGEMRVDGVRYARLSPDRSQLAVIVGTPPMSAIHVIEVATGAVKKIVN